MELTIHQPIQYSHAGNFSKLLLWNLVESTSCWLVPWTRRWVLSRRVSPFWNLVEGNPQSQCLPLMSPWSDRRRICLWNHYVKNANGQSTWHSLQGDHAAARYRVADLGSVQNDWWSRVGITSDAFMIFATATISLICKNSLWRN